MGRENCAPVVVLRDEELQDRYRHSSGLFCLSPAESQHYIGRDILPPEAQALAADFLFGTARPSLAAGLLVNRHSLR